MGQNTSEAVKDPSQALAHVTTGEFVSLEAGVWEA